jgi:hypothetical protein
MELSALRLTDVSVGRFPLTQSMGKVECETGLSEGGDALDWKCD